MAKPVNGLYGSKRASASSSVSLRARSSIFSPKHIRNCVVSCKQVQASAHVAYPAWKAASAGGPGQCAMIRLHSQTQIEWKQIFDTLWTSQLSPQSAKFTFFKKKCFKFFKIQVLPPRPLAIATQLHPTKESAGLTGWRSEAAAHLRLNAAGLATIRFESDRPHFAAPPGLCAA